MMKKSIILLLCLMLVMPVAVLAQEGDLPVLEKPASLTVRSDENNDLQLRLTQPAGIMSYVEGDDVWVLYELDFKINDGPWQFDKNWTGVVLPNGVIPYYEDLYDKMNVTAYLNNIGHDEKNGIDIAVFPFCLGLDDFDLQNDTYSFRYRYLHEYDAQDSATGEWGSKVIASPYSEIASIGKGQTSVIPNNLDAPFNLAGELKSHENGQPYFHFSFVIPESVDAANKQTAVWTKLDWKVGSGKWATELAGVEPFEKADNMLSDDVDVDPIDEGTWEEINIKENTYYFRAFFQLKKPDGSLVSSPFSNTLEIGSPAFFKGASAWAQGDLVKAQEYGLITNRIKENMSGPITREEFAELATRLYEVYTGKKATPAPALTFTDTNNPEIFKAFQLGIVAGVGNNKFAPQVLINREQMAAMLNRAVKVINPSVDLSLAGAPTFADEKDMESYFVENVKFMAKNGFIGGVGNNRFAPKATSTREQAVLIALRVYEAHK